MELSDSRRLTGPNLVLDVPGAAAEIMLASAQRDKAVQLWQVHCRKLLDLIGWDNERCATRLYDSGATLAITAPMDALYAATEVVEAAWDLTRAELKGETPPDIDKINENLKQEITEERDAKLMSLSRAALSKNVTCLSDDDTVTLGLGAGSQSWPRKNTPDAKDVDWDSVTDIPLALVTGTNGKSTTVRIAAAIGAAAGQTVGFSSSDWVKAGSEFIATGDYSGPEGARLALRDKRVDMAVIETARGGLLRRGLPIPRATACLITNIAADHLGEYGIHDVEALADTKFTVSKAVTSRGVLILNADDPRLKARGEAFAGKVAWYGLSLTREDCPQTGYAAFVEGDALTLCENGKITHILPVKEFGPALGGAATYNVSNALGAILLMAVMGIDHAALKQGLLEFGSTIDDNPGRGNFMEIGGVKVILDFAHNPHGLSALTTALNNVPAARRLYLLGQAGDRRDDDILAMTQVIRGAEPDTIIIKELPTKLRGRKLGDIPKMIEAYLADMSYPSDQTLHAGSEYEAVVKAFEWAQPGDLLVLLVYAEREKALGFIQSLKDRNWHAGDPVGI